MGYLLMGYLRRELVTLMGQRRELPSKIGHPVERRRPVIHHRQHQGKQP
jgi:hypothetical protein